VFALSPPSTRSSIADIITVTMASKSGLKQRKATNGKANSHPSPLWKLENSHKHGHGHTDEEEEHGHVEAGMIWDALSGRGSSVRLDAR
jgi:hypothetical protein